MGGMNCLLLDERQRNLCADRTLTTSPSFSRSFLLLPLLRGSAGGHNDIIDSFEAASPAVALGNAAATSNTSLFGAAPAAAAAAATPASDMFGTAPAANAGALTGGGALNLAAATLAPGDDDDLFSMLDDGAAGGAKKADSSTLDLSSYIQSNSDL